jgi:hypothetical protein
MSTIPLNNEGVVGTEDHGKSTSNTLISSPLWELLDDILNGSQSIAGDLNGTGLPSLNNRKTFFLEEDLDKPRHHTIDFSVKGVAFAKG